MATARVAKANGRMTLSFILVVGGFGGFDNG
jgi:hypothetical protein